MGQQSATHIPSSTSPQSQQIPSQTVHQQPSPFSNTGQLLPPGHAKPPTPQLNQLLSNNVNSPMMQQGCPPGPQQQQFRPGIPPSGYQQRPSPSPNTMYQPNMMTSENGPNSNGPPHHHNNMLQPHQIPQQPPVQHIHVFTTQMANDAAMCVRSGQFKGINEFHQAHFGPPPPPHMRPPPGPPGMMPGPGFEPNMLTPEAAKMREEKLAKVQKLVPFIGQQQNDPNAPTQPAKRSRGNGSQSNSQQRPTPQPTGLMPQQQPSMNYGGPPQGIMPGNDMMMYGAGAPPPSHLQQHPSEFMPPNQQYQQGPNDWNRLSKSIFVRRKNHDRDRCTYN